jgi:hypothetical protein
LYKHIKANIEEDFKQFKASKSKPILSTKNQILAPQKPRQIIFLTKQKNTSRVIFIEFKRFAAAPSYLSPTYFEFSFVDCGREEAMV